MAQVRSKTASSDRIRHVGSAHADIYLAPWCNWLTRRPLKAESSGSIPDGATSKINNLDGFADRPQNRGNAVVTIEPRLLAAFRQLLRLSEDRIELPNGRSEEPRRQVLIAGCHSQVLVSEQLSNRTFSSGPEKQTIYTIGRLCSEEFWEIAVLATNGYGYGALRLLRSLFERAVTMAYLSENPSEVGAFLNYHAVAQHRLMRTLQDSFGPDVLPPDKVQEIEREYAEVKNNYLVKLCEKCGTTRVNHTWHKLDVVSMAKKTLFAPIVVPGYYEPMMHSHSTVHALLSRLEKTDGGGLGFNPDSQPKKADAALMTAHNVMLGVMEVQKKFFGLTQVEKPLQTCCEDFAEIWIRQKTEASEA